MKATIQRMDTLEIQNATSAEELRTKAHEMSLALLEDSSNSAIATLARKMLNGSLEEYTIARIFLSYYSFNNLQITHWVEYSEN